jgi:hypothetical protein
MVFDPTFHEIGEQADELPDLDGSDPDEVDEELLDDTPADDLPPEGA